MSVMKILKFEFFKKKINDLCKSNQLVNLPKHCYMSLTAGF